MKKLKVYGSLVCILAAFFYVYDYFIQVAPSVMAHDLMRSFHIGAASLGMLSAAFYYSYTVMQMPAGWLLDKLGARKLLSLSVLLSALGVILFSVAHQLWIAGVGRFLIGLGSAFAFVSAIFLIANWFSHRRFVIYAGLVQMGACIGSIIGLAPVAILVNHYGWRATMLTTGEFTFILAILFWVFIRNNRKAQIKDQTAAPKVQHLFANPQLWVIASCGLVSWVPVAVIGALWGVPYLQVAYHLTNIEAGRYCTLFWVGLGIGSPLMGYVSQRLQLRKMPLVSCYAVAAIASIFLLFTPTLPLWSMGIVLFALGFSASSQSMSFGSIKDIVPESQFGLASGFNNMAAILGGAISQPLVGFMLHYVWNGQYRNHVPYYSLYDFHTAFLLLPLICFSGFIVSSLLLKETYYNSISMHS